MTNSQSTFLFLKSFRCSCLYTLFILKYSLEFYNPLSWFSFFLHTHSFFLYFARFFSSSQPLNLTFLSTTVSILIFTGTLVIKFSPMVLNAIFTLNLSSLFSTCSLPKARGRGCEMGLSLLPPH